LLFFLSPEVYYLLRAPPTPGSFGDAFGFVFGVPALAVAWLTTLGNDVSVIFKINQLY